MMRQVVVLSLVVAGIALTGCRGTLSSRPPLHLNENMDEQQRLDPQEASPHFADGRGMRPRVEGTEPRPTGTTDPVALTGKIGEAFTEELPSGIALDRALLERGHQRYDIYCSPCHAVTGDGNGSVVARGMQPPPSLHDDRLRAYPLGQLFDVITHGSPSKVMPSYAAQIPPEDRWAVAAYVRALQVSQAAELSQVPASVAAEKGWK